MSASTCWSFPSQPVGGAAGAAGAAEPNARRAPRDPPRDQGDVQPRSPSEPSGPDARTCALLLPRPEIEKERAEASRPGPTGARTALVKRAVDGGAHSPDAPRIQSTERPGNEVPRESAT